MGAKRVLGFAVVATACVVISAVALLAAVSGRRLRLEHDVPDITLAIPADSASIERGRHIATSFGTCTLCHGEDMGGALYRDAGPLGIVAGPNLTGGRGGIAGRLSDADWVRAIRYGVRADGSSLLVMPSEVFVNLSDDDLGALIAWLKSAPAVDRDVPASRLRWLGRALLAAGRLPLLTAEKTPRPESVASVVAEPTREYGQYLAAAAGCTGCHGHGLSGGRVAGPPDLPLASNLTPAGAISQWTEAEFTRAVREGVRPGGVPIDAFMPTRELGRMTDDELHAIWLYLLSVPPRPFGNK